MKIVIADGAHKADYIISMYHTKENEIVVINDDLTSCQWIAQKNNVPVFNGDITHYDDLKDAGAEGADLFIALSNDDVKNYIACRTAKLLLNAKRCIAIVMNPKNVETFKKLGIDSVISSTYLLAQQIKNDAALDSLFKTMSFADENILVIDVQITEKSKVVNKKLMDINISEWASIGSIKRDGKIIIPNGSSELLIGDNAFVLTTKDNEKKVMDFFSEQK